MNQDETNRFLQKFAHELRNPLAPIANALQIMALMNLGENVESLRAIMSRQVERLCCLADILSDVSRIDSGGFRIEKDVVALSKIVDCAVQSSTAFVSERGHSLTVSAPIANVFVLADASRMSRAISTLLENASKHSEPSRHIELTARVEGDMVELSVHDEGVGISSDCIDAIFDGFKQPETDRQHGAPGLGVGLAITKAIVGLHSGTIEASSEGIGKGSDFTIRMPLSKPPTESVVVIGSDNQRNENARLRVMIVDDMQSLRHVMAKLIEKLGHTVEVAKDGFQAMDLLDTFSPHVIFSDISMPGMSGYDLVQNLRKRPGMKMVHMVAITGSDQEVDRQTAIELGFDTHMVKPIDFKRLETLFSSLILRPVDPSPESFNDNT